MALQGTLDTFALADLVRLLATTTKTGELAIDGDDGPVGRLWFVDGDLTGGEPAGEGGAEDALFALLRLTDGAFRFDPDAGTAGRPDSADALDVLAAAEARLESWRPIEALVPTLDVGVTLRAELGAESVTLTPELWSRLVAVASGATARDLAEALGLDEVGAATAVKELVDLGVADVGPAVEPLADPAPLEAGPVTAPEAAVAAPHLPTATPEDQPAEPAAEDGAEAGPDAATVTVDAASSAEDGREPDPEPAFGTEPGFGFETEPTFAPEPEPAFAPEPEPVAAEPEPALDTAPEPAFEPEPGLSLVPALPVDDEPLVAGEHDADAAEPLVPEAHDVDGEPEVAPSPWTVTEPWDYPDADVPAAPDGRPAPSSPDADALPSLDEGPGHDPFAPAATDDASLAVDLDSHLGGPAAEHDYLGGGRSAALPEALPESLPEPPADEAPERLPEEAPAPVGAAGPTDLDHGDEDAPGAEEPDQERVEVASPANEAAAPVAATPAPRDEPSEWPAPAMGEDELALQLEALSPAAARAVAAAASQGGREGDDGDMGRRVLRRIISSGRG